MDTPSPLVVLPRVNYHFLKLIFIVRLHFKSQEHSGPYLYSYRLQYIDVYKTNKTRKYIYSYSWKRNKCAHWSTWGDIHAVWTTVLQFTLMSWLTVWRLPKTSNRIRAWLVFQTLLQQVYHWPVPLSHNLWNQHHYNRNRFRTSPAGWNRPRTRENLRNNGIAHET